MRPDAVLFDMDGVVLDTERLYLEAFSIVGHRHELEDVEDYFRRIQGTNPDTLKNVFDETYQGRYDFHVFYSEVEKTLDEMLGAAPPPMKSGVREFLSYLREQQIPAALYSSSKSERVFRFMRENGIDGLFGTIIGGDMVTRSKPDPQGYLLAAEKLGVEPTNTCVIEDSHNGIRAAHNGRFRAIMIPDTIPVTEEMKQLTEVILPDMEALKNYLFI